MATRTDFGAAVTGLIVGGCLLFVFLFGIVQYTNHKYAGESHAAGATK
jgi:hypothetical protein